MGSMWSVIIPMAFAALLAAPAMLVVSVFIISTSRRPLASGWTFVAGAALLDLAFGFGVYTLISRTGLAGGRGIASALIDICVGLLFLFLGLETLLTRDTPEKEEKRDKVLERIAGMSVSGMLLVGMAGQALNFDALAIFTSALKELAQESLGFGEASLAITVFILIMLAVYYLPVLFYSVMPKTAGKLLQPVSTWVTKRLRALEIITGIGFGIIFLSAGIGSLLRAF